MTSIARSLDASRLLLDLVTMPRLSSRLLLASIACAGLAGCADDRTPDAASAPAVEAVAAGAGGADALQTEVAWAQKDTVPHPAPRPGQNDEGFEFSVTPLDLWPTPAVRSAALGAAGAQTHLSERAMALMVGVGQAVQSGLPDPDAALAALEAYTEAEGTEAKRLGERLQTVKSGRTPRQNRQWAKMARVRFSEEIATYQRALAEFEAVAEDGHIVRLNALVKSFTAPMRVER